MNVGVSLSNKRKVQIIFIMVIILLTIFVSVNLGMSFNYLTVNKFTVKISDINNNTIHAIVISDLHDHKFSQNNIRLANKIQELQPDIIFMDGDMLNEDSENAEVPCNLIRQLKNIAPIYFALGNHELSYIDNYHPNLIEQLEEAGAVVLDKEYADIDINGVQIRLGGMYDYAFGLDGNDTALAAPTDVLSFLEDYQNTDRIKIMLSHRPESFVLGDASKTWNIDLIISGHIHGGQVVLPFVGGLYGGDQGWFPEYVHGIYDKDNFQIFVTSGLSSHRQLLPRFNNLPEIAVLNIEV